MVWRTGICGSQSDDGDPKTKTKCQKIEIYEIGRTTKNIMKYI